VSCTASEPNVAAHSPGTAKTDAAAHARGAAASSCTAKAAIAWRARGCPEPCLTRSTGPSSRASRAGRPAQRLRATPSSYTGTRLATHTARDPRHAGHTGAAAGMIATQAEATGAARTTVSSHARPSARASANRRSTSSGGPCLCLTTP